MSGHKQTITPVPNPPHPNKGDMHGCYTNEWQCEGLSVGMSSSRQVDAPLGMTLSIVASIRQPYRCGRIDKI